MATLGKIRNRSGLLLAVIGIAMLAFILGDFMQSKRSGPRGSIHVGEVYGEKILRQDFEIKLQDYLDNTWKVQNPQTVLTQSLIAQIRSQIWNQYVRDLIMDFEYERIGIDVSDDEFFELLQGVNVHPEISKVPAFQGPSGAFDRTKVLAYLKQIDEDPSGESRERWIGFQDYLINLIKNAKYNSLIGKAMYYTSNSAIEKANENQQKSSFTYVSLPYSIIPDSLVEASEKEMARYYKENKQNYQQEESRDVDYIVFNVLPSLSDDELTKSSLQELVSDFIEYEDYELLCRRNSDNTNTKFVFSKQNQLEDENWNQLFSKDKGAVIGPYLTKQGFYRISKLADVQYRPDSVEARHILIKPTQSMNLDSVNKTIEQLKLRIENGSDFGLLANQYSEDKGSSIKGGDLGWFEEGAMVDEFNEACFTSKKGDLKIVSSQFGVHLIEVTSKSKKVKKVKIAYIDRFIEPSTETYNQFYSKASKFAAKLINEEISFDSLVVKENIMKRSDFKVQINKENISGLTNSREMIRWMYSSKTGDISDIFQFENNYVIAHLIGINKEGDIPIQNVKEEIKSLVIKEKKSDLISKKYSNVELSKIASDNSKSILNANTTLANLSVAGIGYEPELVGSVFSFIDNNSTVKFVKGRNAMYFVSLLNLDEAISLSDVSQQKKKMLSDIQSYAQANSFNSLKESAKVKDNRSEFY